MRLRPDPARTLEQQVADHITYAILERRLRPGEHLVADALAAELGVSRLPVRDALRSLAGHGLVELHPHRGAFVATIDLSSPAEMVELISVRLQLEPWAVAEAARHHTPADLAAIDDAIETGATAIAAGDLAITNRAHHDMLQALAAGAHNRYLTLALTPLHHRTAIAFALAAHQPTIEGWREHERLRDAIAARDAEAAAQTLDAQLRGALAAVRQATHLELPGR